MKPKVLIFSGFGLNCEEETKFAFDKAGADAEIVHINDLIDGLYSLSKYQIAVFPGGFAYGDDTGSGNAFANKLKNHLWDDMEAFVKRDTLTLGICNGFQIITHLGLVPALNDLYGEKQTALLHNASARYIDRWTDLEITNSSPWLTGIKTLSLPIAHGEGKFYTSKETLAEMKKKDMIALRYMKGETCMYQDLEANPTGTLESIAGITNQSGRILGMMPHPERAISFTQLPNWTYLKEKYKRENKPIPKDGPGLAIFKNAVTYFKN